MRHLQSHGLRANKAKCEVFKEKITFCGHDIDNQGLHKSSEKVKAVVDVSRPQSVTEVRLFVGLVNCFNNRFKPNLSTLVQPLKNHIREEPSLGMDRRTWSSFPQWKRMITSEKVLTHYDPCLPLRLTSDASPIGIGAILSHVMNQ